MNDLTTPNTATGLAPLIPPRALADALGIHHRPLWKGISLGNRGGIKSTLCGRRRLLETESAIRWLTERQSIVSLVILAETAGDPYLVGSFIGVCTERGIPIAWWAATPYVSAKAAQVLVALTGELKP